MKAHLRLGCKKWGHEEESDTRRFQRNRWGPNCLVVPIASLITFKVFSAASKVLWDLASGYSIFHFFLLTSHGNQPSCMQLLHALSCSQAFKRMCPGPAGPLALAFCLFQPWRLSSEFSSSGKDFSKSSRQNSVFVYSTKVCRASIIDRDLCSLGTRATRTMIQEWHQLPWKPPPWGLPFLSSRYSVPTSIITLAHCCGLAYILVSRSGLSSLFCQVLKEFLTINRHPRNVW